MLGDDKMQPKKTFEVYPDTVCCESSEHTGELQGSKWENNIIEYCKDKTFWDLLPAS